MEQFEIYKQLQGHLLSMKGEEEINEVKDFILKNDLLKDKSKSLATIRLIASVVYSNYKLINNVISLLNLIGYIRIKKPLTTYINHNEIRLRASIIESLFKSRRKEYDHIMNYENKIHSNNSLIKAIIDDDINSFQSFISKNNIDIHDPIQQDHKYYPELNGSKAIEYAAFFGSIKCFKYLMMNMKSINYERLLKYSIEGGNAEIIHIVEGQNPNLDSSEKSNLLDSAILLMRNDLIEYLVNTYEIPIIAENYIKCIYSSNYEAMTILRDLDKSNAINEYGEIGSTPIDISAFEDYLDFFTYFMSIKEVDYKKLNNYGKTILQSAVRGNSVDIVYYIDKHHIINFNDRGKYHLSVYQIAIVYGIRDVKRYFRNRLRRINYYRNQRRYQRFHYTKT